MKVSIVVPVSRTHCIPLVIENLKQLKTGSHEPELIIIQDGVSHEWRAELEQDYPKMLVSTLVKPRITASNVPRIRDRIAHIRNESKESLSKTDFVFSFEDDTIIPSTALLDLFESWQELSRRDKVGLVSGIQVGRHGRRVLGAWYADSYQFPTELTTLGMHEIKTPIAEVDGTGMYCYLTPTKLYKSATYGWNPPVGPDVWYGLWLRTQGYHNYVNQSVVCGHVVGDRTLVPNDEVVKVKFFQKAGQWVHDVVK